MRGNEKSERVYIEESNVTLKVLYEDPDIVVVTAPNEDELREIVLDMLKESPKTLKDMHSRLAGIASEDKIRRCLVRLMDEGIVVVDDDGKYKLLGAEEFNGGLEEEEYNDYY
uniref:ArsR family transcriptional regulator n=1 Tax=Ignisphaera aggregans TaxID=334771 RepID=A0A7J3Z5Q5_9CREN